MSSYCLGGGVESLAFFAAQAGASASPSAFAFCEEQEWSSIVDQQISSLQDRSLGPHSHLLYSLLVARRKLPFEMLLDVQHRLASLVLERVSVERRWSENE